MSYKLPSTHIYQLLENSGGAANITPDLSAVIIGTLMNLVDIDIDKAKARSSDFSVWPRSVIPVTPPVESFFTLDSAEYVDFGFGGKGIVIKGTSSDDIGVNFGISLIESEYGDNLTEIGRYYWNTAGTPDSGFTQAPVYTRDASTGAWTFTTTGLEVGLGGRMALLNGVSDSMSYDGISEVAYKYQVVATSGNIVKSIDLSRKLAPISFIASPELKIVVSDTVSLTVDDPTIFYYYDHVINEASNK